MTDITAAKDALMAVQAHLTPEDVTDVRTAIDTVNAHIDKCLRFAGCNAPLEIPVRQLTEAGMKALALLIGRKGWAVRADLMSLPPRFQGAPPDPHHWNVYIAPREEAYEAAAALAPLDGPPLATA